MLGHQLLYTLWFFGQSSRLSKTCWCKRFDKYHVWWSDINSYTHFDGLISQSPPPSLLTSFGPERVGGPTAAGRGRGRGVAADKEIDLSNGPHFTFDKFTKGKTQGWQFFQLYFSLSLIPTNLICTNSSIWPSSIGRPDAVLPYVDKFPA